MYLLGLRIRIFNSAVALGLHPLLIWLCCLCSARALTPLAQIRRWERANQQSVSLNRENAKESFVARTDLAQLNKKPHASYKLAALTLLLFVGFIALASGLSSAALALQESGTRLTSGMLFWFSATLLLLIFAWITKKFVAKIKAHYIHTKRIGTHHATLGQRPWDGLF